MNVIEDPPEPPPAKKFKTYYYAVRVLAKGIAA